MKPTNQQTHTHIQQEEGDENRDVSAGSSSNSSSSRHQQQLLLRLWTHLALFVVETEGRGAFTGRGANARRGAVWGIVTR